MSKLVLTMENDSAIGGSGDEDLVAAANTATEVEAGAAESAEVENSVSDIDTGISDAGDAVDGLADVQAEVADAVDSGEGLSEREARLAEMAVEGYCKMVGIDARKERLFPSIENFGGRHSRTQASRIVLESVGETMKRIWEAIKAAVARVIEMVKSFFNGIVKNVDSLSKHIRNLQDRVKDIPSTAKPKDSTISTGAKLFTIDGNAKKGNITTVVECSVKFMQAVEGVNNSVKKLMHDAFYSDSGGGAMTSSDGTADIAAARTHKYMEQFESDMVSLLSGLGTRKGKDLKAANGEILAVFGTLPDGYSVAVRTEKLAKGGAANAVAKVSIKVERNETPSTSSIEAPNKRDMEDILGKLDAPLDALKKFDRTSKLAQKTLDEMMAHAAKMSKLAGETAAAKENDKDNADAARNEAAKKNKAFTDQINTMKSISVDAPAMAFKAIKGAADYVAAGISNMKVDKS